MPFRLILSLLFVLLSFIGRGFGEEGPCLVGVPSYLICVLSFLSRSCFPLQTRSQCLDGLLRFRAETWEIQ